tara:strand:- start:55 stop:636 length:582 start_codon:yes stop_codon:yes gene_type:complete
MGNLTDVGHGVGKYLTAADATTIPQIIENTVDIENLHFKLATNNSYAIATMKDGFIDAFQDTSGVDASASTNETRDGSGEYYWGNGSNLTLICNTQTAVAAPTIGRLVIFEEAATGTTTINTDVKGFVSRDNGSNYDELTLVNKVDYASGKRLLEGSIAFTMASGVNMRYKVTTLNQSGSKATRIHGVSMLWY